MGTKPMLSFAGDAWENELELKDGSKIDFKRIRNLFVDFFRGDTIDNVRRTGLELLMQFTLQEGKNLFFFGVRGAHVHNCERRSQNAKNL